MSTVGGEGARSAGELFSLIRSGQATTRADLARLTGLAGSTVSSRVDALLELGYLVERQGSGAGRGRRPRTLAVRTDRGVFGVADLGQHHAVVGVVELDGALAHQATLPLCIEDGPAKVVPWVAQAIRDVVADVRGASEALVGVAVGLPGPVDNATQRLVSPARMPGWNGVNVQAMLEELTGLLALVENDANLMAVGEHSLLGGDIEHLIFVKLGTGIGCGVIASGSLYRGERGAAGDISHLRVAGVPDVICSCGRSGCLEALASGAAIVRELRTAGVEIDSAAQILELIDRSEPTVARILRSAGRATGEVLAGLISFFNPQALVLGGVLSQAEPFVATLRATLYDRCLPMTMDDLVVTSSKAGSSAGVLGAGRLLLEHVFHSDTIDAAVSARA